MPVLSSITSGSLTSKTYTARPSQVVFTTTGVTQWIVPPGVFSISAFMVSGGQGGGAGTVANGVGGYGGQGGSTLWVEKIPVSPGLIVAVTVGAGGTPGTFSNLAGFPAGGPSGIIAGTFSCNINNAGVAAVSAGAIWSKGVGGLGGQKAGFGSWAGGGGGAGGYGTVDNTDTSANGGTGEDGDQYGEATANGGGATGGRRGTSGFVGTKFAGGGGGVGLLGRGTTAVRSIIFPAGAGLGGSGGANGISGTGGLYGGGGGGGGAAGEFNGQGGPGGQGAVRIIWGSTRYYPTSNTENY